jgi:hypothetical protein
MVFAGGDLGNDDTVPFVAYQAQNGLTGRQGKQ